jgi:hypothetical protein
MKNKYRKLLLSCATELTNSKTMKKHLTLILALAAMASLTGCKDKLPPTKWDYPNENIVIYVTNSAGKDILTKGSDIFKNKIKIIYDGTTYELTTPATRANAPELPEMKGVRWVEVMWENQNNYLLFGEFSIVT